MSFHLHRTLAADSVFLCDLALSQVRLMKNAAFPWLLLIPRKADLVELFDLPISEQEQLLREVRQAAEIMKRQFSPKKLNIAAIGNIVAQLHIHVIARQETDKAWPAPVWNSGITEEYAPFELEQLIASLHKAFTE